MSPEAKQFEGTLTKDEIKALPEGAIKNTIKALDNMVHDKRAEIAGLREELQKPRTEAAKAQREAIEFIGPLNQCLGVANFRGQYLF